MVSSRSVTAVVGLLASLLVSVAAWYYFETFLLFLFVPFVPFLLRGHADTGSSAQDSPPSKPSTRAPSSTSPTSPDATRRECPVCGFRTSDRTFEYCPRDGTRLE